MNFSLEDQKINTYDCAIRWLAREKRTYRIFSLLYTLSCGPVSEEKKEIELERGLVGPLWQSVPRNTTFSLKEKPEICRQGVLDLRKHESLP